MCQNLDLRFLFFYYLLMFAFFFFYSPFVAFLCFNFLLHPPLFFYCPSFFTFVFLYFSALMSFISSLLQLAWDFGLVAIVATAQRRFLCSV
jgi:hypothetical protein